MQIAGKILLIAFFTFVAISPGNTEATEDIEINQLWLECRLDNVVSFEVFKTAMLGYRQIINLKKRNIVSIIDFSKPSTEKRFFVIDLKKKELLYRCFVAHGKNSGDNFAKSFSNQSQSMKSSMGFFITAETYSGRHGYSLRLDGLERSINDNTREREIVIHGAEYVSEEYIKQVGRLGRSWGCPALPPEISKEVIDEISNGSCLFIYGEDSSYKENSAFISKK